MEETASQLAFLLPAALFMVSMTITPGPNNVMLTASGANYGFLRTLPHLFGILGGCFVLFASIALGLILVACCPPGNTLKSCAGEITAATDLTSS